MGNFSKGATRVLALVAALSMLFAVPVAAGNTPERLTPEGPGVDRAQDLAPEFTENLWFIEFEGEPEIRGGQAAALERQRAGLARAAERAGIDFEQRFDFQRLWNGVSVRATAADAAALSRLGEVAAVYPVALIDRPEPQDVDPDMATALSMTGADVAGSELGFTGEGLKVAILDTGIDYGHPDLGGDGEGTTFPTDRVTHGFDFAGDDYNAADPENDVPSPNPDPMDIHGHGTHVAGIVGASAADDGGVTGLAPNVTFGAYKVFGTTGSSSADVIIAALEAAHADGMDVVNMSLGAAFAWGDYPTSTVSDTLVDEGVVVVASAGNSGREGAFSTGAPGNARNVIGVASADNLSMNAEVLEIAGEDVPYAGIGAAPEPPDSGESDPIEWIGRACVSEGDELEGDPEGKTALIVRGECTFEEKYNVAVGAGATGVIIYNNIPGLFSGGGIVPQDDIWAAGITQADGQWVRDLVSSDDNVTVTFTDRQTSVINPTAGLLSDFSSYGMTPDLQSKPSITAPGGLIRSTYPLANGEYATVSGTSMSAPHVAGAVALLLEARPDLAADEVRGVLQNSAEPLAWSLNPGAGLLEPSYRQGAGMLQIDKSITNTTSVSPSRFLLGEQEVVSTTLEIANHGDEAVTYHLGHEGTIGTGGFGDDPWGDWATIQYPQFVGPTTQAQFGASSVTVEAGDTVSVDVSLVNPHYGLYAHQAGGYVTVTEDGADSPTAVVPFAGLAGQLTDIEIWPEERPGAVGLDNLLVTTYDEDGNLLIAPEGHTFDATAGEQPVAAVFMGFAAQRVEVTAVHEDGRTLPVAEVDFARRSASPTEYPTYSWDGRVGTGQGQGRPYAPSGTYTFEVRALPVGADASDESAWVHESTYSFELEGGPVRGGGN
jgi:minor extracellular serine protease Vpr